MSDFTPLREAVDDLTSRTPSPNLDERERRATRRGRRRVVTVAGAVAYIAVGGGLAAGALGGSDQLSPIGETTTPSAQSPSVPESAEASPTSYEALGTQLHAITTQVPGWAVIMNPDYTDYDNANNGPCSGNWGKGATSGSDGGVPPPPSRRSSIGMGILRFPSDTRASDAAARLVQNLASCNKTPWRTEPIAQTGAVLASSPNGVAWIQQTGDWITVLGAPTTDGPPPLDVQIEVAEWMDAHITWQEQQFD